MRSCLFLLCVLLSHAGWSQELYNIPEGEQTRWISFENPTGAKGSGGLENKQAKGHAWDIIRSKSQKVIFDVKGSAVINRIWMTLSDRAPEALKNIYIEMYWEDNREPSVSVPVSDFFGFSLGKMVPFQSALFSSPEGRSFNATVKMPFRKAGKIVMANRGAKDITLFYDVNYTQTKLPANILYFHAHYATNENTKVGDDFVILPGVKGRGRFIGTNFGLVTDSSYKSSWWGEGEIKMYIDGDDTAPTLINSGTEDYVGTAYRQGAFAHLYQGSPVADLKTGTWCFYRYHIPDAVVFYKSIKVAIQQMGGDQLDKVRNYLANGALLIPVSVTGPNYLYKHNLMEEKLPEVTDEKFPKGWVNFYRKDHYVATSYYYLDRP